MCNKPKIKNPPAPVAAAPAPPVVETNVQADVDTATTPKKRKSGKQNLTIGINNTRGTGLNI